MHSTVFVLFIFGTCLLQVQGDWFRDMESTENRERSLPNEVTLNGDVKKCGIVLQPAMKCSCQALVCDAQESCEHSFGPFKGYRYELGCKLTKPWDQIDAQAATFGGPSDDCYCKGRAIMA